MAGLSGTLDVFEPIHLPFVSRLGARDSAKCYGHHLADMYLQANPNRGKTVEEKEEMRKKYKPGDSVMPKLEMEMEGTEEEADRRMMEEVRELSLRDVGIQNGGSYESRVRHGGMPRDRDTRDEDARQQRRPDEARRRRHEG
ncbi:ring finger domain-containing protein [Lasallia pustulata]|uniref:Ring finger domain-containing protein n=1 Tax=Lasallia pustulata TaxID=136370 RepID=A0A1W5D8T5_9LECA|nr:ring finger domain-containing protein [Lasallia pustulata]